MNKLFLFIKKNSCTIIIIITICILLITSTQTYSVETFTSDDKYIIKNSDIHGKGVFANKDIAKNERIGLVMKHILNKQTNKPYADITPNFGSIINHCEEKTNAYLHQKGVYYYLHAKKNITNGEEITCDYRMAPDTVRRDVSKYKQC
jgi:SET domain-containing protein